MKYKRFESWSPVLSAMKRLISLIVLTFSFLRDQTAETPLHNTLNEIRKNVAMQIIRADNYICVQELSRFYYQTTNGSQPCEHPPHVPDSKPAMKDRLRLDVTVSQGNEIYAWHGDKQFSSKSLMDIVQHGPVSSGGFTGYLRNIFLSAGIEFIYREKTVIEGKTMLKFDYRVPLKVSRYQIKAANEMVLVPFHGSFIVLADSLELQTLTVTADSDAIPKNAELCAIQSTVVYQLAHISKDESLIPQSFKIIYGSSQGRSVTESQGQFTQCRQFSGESTVRFDGEETAGQDSKSYVQAASIKPGVTLRIALQTGIDSDGAYAGMPVLGVLAHPAKVGNGVVVPAGTLIEGIITRFETYYSPEPQTLMVLEFDHLTAANKTYFFRAIHSPDFYQMMHPPRGVMLPGRRMGSSGTTSYNPASEQEPGVILFPRASIHLDKKFVAEYETVPVK